ncbi:LytR C-terminal domain-containing protein [Nocardioides jishulii]|uniref:LytR family transcriptional regulator n=1 Tax=Nocardioides jishulii TaxID=2575440 RepID=A0A4U2YU67_9ACTN|nr:LytR C-terminal domain-containing protein [Nocardioides jishulii]QCX28851.1 LytR family transcriptional regulator [Nocardioides jishulii]TKI64252.1 LytR family transcriptional regulator [Nocardioides jishulii]
MSTPTSARLTLTVLVAITALAAVVGWFAMTRPFPTTEDLPPCVETRIADRQEVFPAQVTVSVYNASSRNGLAGRTMGDLTGRGFVAARTGNVDKKVRGVQIWADNAKNPAVALVRAQFRKAKVVKGEALGPGVVVVVGDGSVPLRDVGKAPTSVKSTGPATICSPPGAADTPA